MPISLRLGTTLLKQRNPVSTRFELASLGLLGVFWLALGSFLLASEAGDADVECFDADSSEDDPVDFPGCECLWISAGIHIAKWRVLLSSLNGNFPCAIPCIGSFFTV